MTRREVGYMQGLITVLFFVGYFITLHDFIEGRIKTPLEWQDTLKTLLGALTAGIGAIVYFWFNRSRESANQEPPNAQA